MITLPTYPIRDYGLTAPIMIFDGLLYERVECW